MELEAKIERLSHLLKKRSINDFEIYGTASDTIRAESKDYAMGSLNRSRESGLAIRVLLDDAMGFAYGADPTNELVEAALTSAKYQFKDPNNRLPDRQEGYAGLDIHDPALEGLSAEECIERAVSLERAAREADSRIQHVRKASFSRTVSRVSVLNSHGVQASTLLSMSSASIMVVAREGDDILSFYDFGFVHHLADVDIGLVGSQAAKRATDMLRARRIQTMKAPVLFDNATTAQILEFISDAFIGENVIKGKSFLADKLGRTYFSGNVT